MGGKKMFSGVTNYYGHKRIKMSDEQKKKEKKGHQINLGYVFKKMMGVKKFYGGGGGGNKIKKRSSKNFAYTFKAEVITSKNG